MREMKYLSLGLLLVSLVAVTPAQRRRSEARLNKSLPSVYISFVRFGKAGPVKEGESGGRIWLRLHNNTRWSIELKAYGLPDEYGDAGMYYDLMSKDEMLPESERFHGGSVIPLASGKSLLFSVPREHLSNDRELRIHFSFDWQDRDDISSGREIDNIVSFFASRLPKAAL